MPPFGHFYNVPVYVDRAVVGALMPRRAALLHPEVAADLLPPGAAVRVDLLAQRQAQA